MKQTDQHDTSHFKLNFNAGHGWDMRQAELPSFIPLDCGFALRELFEGQTIEKGDVWFHLGEFNIFKTDHLDPIFFGLFGFRPRQYKRQSRTTARIFRLEFHNPR